MNYMSLNEGKRFKEEIFYPLVDSLANKMFLLGAITYLSQYFSLCFWLLLLLSDMSVFCPISVPDFQTIAKWPFETDLKISKFCHIFNQRIFVFKFDNIYLDETLVKTKMSF